MARDEPANLINDMQFLTAAMIRLVPDVLSAKMDVQTVTYYYGVSALLMLTMVRDRLSPKTEVSPCFARGPGGCDVVGVAIQYISLMKENSLIFENLFIPAFIQLKF